MPQVMVPKQASVTSNEELPNILFEIARRPTVLVEETADVLRLCRMIAHDAGNVSPRATSLHEGRHLESDTGLLTCWGSLRGPLDTGSGNGPAWTRESMLACSWATLSTTLP
mmetsp:Transcript_29874/g.68856  ORF Transcript_29874/g.68856 Transcript_29874/m.68856 type:complete len:112 (-) Transcript_29874:1-336(-)